MTGETESNLYTELTSLIRQLYNKEEAEEIVETFEATLAANPTVEARLGILAHWVDFYRLRKYRRDRQRRRPSFRERTSACAACGYPASHRHHIYDLATHGEHTQTVQLCANCHELQHLLYNVLVNESDYSQKLVNHMMVTGKIASVTFAMLLQWCRQTIRYEASRGWVDVERASDEWVEMRLHWSEFTGQSRVKS